MDSIQDAKNKLKDYFYKMGLVYIELVRPFKPEDELKELDNTYKQQAESAIDEAFGSEESTEVERLNAASDFWDYLNDTNMWHHLISGYHDVVSKPEYEDHEEEIEFSDKTYELYIEALDYLGEQIQARE